MYVTLSNAYARRTFRQRLSCIRIMVLNDVFRISFIDLPGVVTTVQDPLTVQIKVDCLLLSDENEILKNQINESQQLKLYKSDEHEANEHLV